MWSKNGSPVLARTSPVGRRGRSARRCSSPWWCAPWLRHGWPVAHLSASSQGGEEGVVLGGGADRDTEAAVEARPRGAVAHEHRAVEQALPHRRDPSRSRGRNSTKLAPDGHTSTGRSAKPATRRPRSSTRRATRPRISSAKSRAMRPAACLTASRWYGSTTWSSWATSERGPDEVAEAGRGHRPRLRVGAGDDEGHVVVDEVEGRPRRELAVGLVDHEQPGRQVEDLADSRPRPRPCRWGCWASTGR